MATREDLESFVTRVTRPDDFEDFWKETMAVLAEIPLEPQIVPDKLRSTP